MDIIEVKEKLEAILNKKVYNALDYNFLAGQYLHNDTGFHEKILSIDEVVQYEFGNDLVLLYSAISVISDEEGTLIDTCAKGRTIKLSEVEDALMDKETFIFIVSNYLNIIKKSL